MSMFDNLDFTKRDKAVAKLESMGYEEFGRERCPKGAITFRKGNKGKKAKYDGTIEDFSFNFENYDNDSADFEEMMSRMGRENARRRQVSGINIAPPFGSGEVVYSNTGNVQKKVNQITTIVALIGVGVGIIYLLQK